jgi:uncharacterized protein YbjT (DUF2867 family)
LRILVTGANGHLGRRLVEQLLDNHEVIAVVRSPRAQRVISDLSCQVQVIRYEDGEALTAAARDCDCAVHLVGIIKSSSNNTYQQAHEQPSAALAFAAGRAGLKQIVALSIIGSDAVSGNGCLASRGLSENILLNGTVPVTILRVPMVLGESDYAAASLRQKAGRKIGITFRAASKEQPIYAGDVVEAICSLIRHPLPDQILELGGPESLSRRQLIKRAGQVLGKRPIVFSLPVGIGKWLGRILDVVMPSPPITEDMIDLLDHDDEIDALSVADKLGIRLTSLEVMLGKVIRE